jgi:hypothetical protein
MPGLAHLEVVVPPSIEGAVDLLKLYMHACAADKLKNKNKNKNKNKKTTRKNKISGPWPLNTSPQVNAL